MAKPVQQQLPGTRPEKTCEVTASHTSQPAKLRVSEDISRLYQVAGEMVRLGGGLAALVEALDREPSYDSKVSDGTNRRRGAHFQLDWLAPLLDCPSAAELLIAWLSERCGFEPPVRQREVTREQVAQAALEVAGELGPLKDTFRDLIAKRLGVKPDRVKL